MGEGGSRNCGIRDIEGRRKFPFPLLGLGLARPAVLRRTGAWVGNPYLRKVITSTKVTLMRRKDDDRD